MKIAGEFRVAAPGQRVWDSFMAEETLAAWIPGCKGARWESSERITVEIEQSVAQLKAAFTFDLAVAGQSPPHSIRLRGTGQGVAINSGVVLDMELELSELEDGGTLVRYSCEVEISGRLAKVGEFVLKLKAKEVQKQLERDVKASLEGARAD